MSDMILELYTLPDIIVTYSNENNIWMNRPKIQFFSCKVSNHQSGVTTMKISMLPMIIAINGLGSQQRCIQKFTNRPLNGYYCNNEHYQTLRFVSQHKCTHNCITSPMCGALSYNPQNRLCLLSSEPCPVAEEHPEFMLMVFRYTLEERCDVWIPKDGETGASRLVRSHIGNDNRVGRFVNGSNIYVGGTAGGKLWYPRREHTNEESFTSYEVLTTSSSCTLAWLPYHAGDVLPKGALKTGYLVDSGPLYSANLPMTVVYNHVVHVTSLHFGHYTLGDAVGYIPYYGSFRTADMSILIVVWIWRNFFVFTIW